MVRPIGKVLRDSEVTARDLSFKSVWKELKNEGWTRKPPPRRSLDDRYFYIRPGESSVGTEGVHFFRGEESVLEYYANVLRSRASIAAFRPPKAPGDAQLAAAAEVVRQTYTADILAAEARVQATAPTQASAPATQAPAPTTQASAPATQAPASSVPRAASAAVSSTPSPQAPTIRHAKARRALVQSASPMATTPPRSIRFAVQPLLATSPHAQDSDSAFACERVRRVCVLSE